jgi:alpha-beta hydrolase superfamily lysophospholipase
VARSTANLPFFIMGHSMGGGAALLVANILRKGRSAVTRSSAFADSQAWFEEHVLPHFQGALLVCPVIDLRLPPVVQSLVLAPLAALIPHSSIPAWLFDESSQSHRVWASPRYRAFIQADGWPANADGLSFGGNIRFGMLHTILSLAAAVQRTTLQATFPLVVLQDMEEGGDILVPAASSAAFVALAPARVKFLVNVPGGLHDSECARAPAQVSDWGSLAHTLSPLFRTPRASTLPPSSRKQD